ncbi:hypothetical protein BD408DRAFT_412721, partial [Parasitella parasitica]
MPLKFDSLFFRVTQSSIPRGNFNFACFGLFGIEKKMFKAYVCMYVCLYVCMYVRMYVYVCMNICIYVWAYLL